MAKKHVPSRLPKETPILDMLLFAESRYREIESEDHQAWLQEITDNVNRRLRGLPRVR